MDSVLKLKYDNPKKKANPWSRLFFIWIIGLFRKGVKEKLNLIDLYKRMDCDDSARLTNELEKHWEIEIQRAKHKNVEPSLLRAISKTFFWSYMIQGFYLFIIYVVLRSPQPVVLSYFIKQFAPGQERDMLSMYIYGGALVGILAVFVVLNHHTTFGTSCVGMRIRIAVSSLVYRKIMKLNQASLGKTAAGQVVNLLSNDVIRFDLVAIMLHFLWIMPFQIALITYFLWQEVGISCLAGIVSMILLTLPVQGYLGKLTSKLRLMVAERTDKRVMLMSEIISGIQVIKMYAWEKPFEKMIKYLRVVEIRALTKASYLRAYYVSSMLIIERLTLFLTITCYILLGFDITSDKVFSMAQFFNILQLATAILFPQAITFGAETLVSIKRLEQFLSLEEKETVSIEKSDVNEINIQNISAAWVPEYPVLKNISIHVPPGKLIAVIGPVGAGKSTLLQLLLGELAPSSGRMQLGGEISYSSQEAWIFASSVRKNILFGQKYDSLHYKKVTDVCALEKDFKQFPQGDKTIVGERGASLSGGQRARINLARAVYKQADIYLLDDPLSAVDTHVGKHLFEKCIVGYLKNKTRILVTHQLQYLKKVDHLVVINEGRIEAQGTFEELSNTNLDFTKMLIAADETTDEQENEKGAQECLVRQSSHLEESLEKSILTQSMRRRTSMFSMSESIIENALQNEEDEEESSNVTGESPFKSYMKAIHSTCLVATLIIALIAAQTACAGTDYWVAYWTNQEELRVLNQSYAATERPSLMQQIDVFNLDSNDSNKVDSYYSYVPGDDIRTPPPHPLKVETFSMSFEDFFEQIQVNDGFMWVFKTDVAMYLYGIMIILAVILTVIRSMLFYFMAMRASKNIHADMFHCLLRAPMRFFDTNLSGRVLNRFSKDMGAVDEILPRTLIDAIQIMLVMFGILFNVAASNYYMIIAIVILGIVFLNVEHWFIANARAIKHLEGITKSPVFSHVSSSLNGLTTIRASRAERVLIKEFDEHQNVHTSAWFLIIMCIVSFGLWLDIVCVMFVGCVTFAFVITEDLAGGVNASLVGLAVSQALILAGMVQYGMRQIAEVVNQLTSVERVQQYTRLDTEGPFPTPEENKPKGIWPSDGRVEFIDLCLYYAPDDPPVLKHLNFTILPGEKVGIVGRTGAGKSSLISALFRLAPTEGTILIDEVDTKKIGLEDLRKNISIIPQEPVLFSATLRYNLDPFDDFDDQKLWKALEEVELKDAVDSLDFKVSEGGSNFSLGQRQLLCLARAILRNNKILVLDEATANVDPRTDALIQTTIRKKFKHCTVLTIAHRLNTIMDSDKVLVMGSGRMLEFDHPHELLQIPDGYFYQMVLETGPSMTSQLIDVAAVAWDQKYVYSDSFPSCYTLVILWTMGVLNKENPKKNANLLSRILFLWIIGLFRKGVKQKLNLVDMYKHMDCDDSEKLAIKLERNWNIEIKRANGKNVKPSLLRAISKTFFWSYMAQGLYVFIGFELVRSPQPLVLSYFIKQFVPGQERNTTAMYTYGGVLVGITAVFFLIFHHTNFGQSCIGMRVRIAVSALVYRKIMKLNQASLGKTADGQVVNLLSNDVIRFDLVSILLHFLWIMPFQVALITYFLWQQVGISCLAGVVSMALLTLPVQGYLGKLTSKLRLMVAERTDKRVMLMSEIISGIQVIKMYAWEKPFEKMIKFLRVKEIKALSKAGYLRAYYLSSIVIIERLSLFLTITCYILLGFNITPDKIFSMAQFFNILQCAIAIFFPRAITFGAETLVSIKRLENFLMLEEKETVSIRKSDVNEIKIHNVTAAWVPEYPVLKNVSIHVPPGKLIAVVGPVGTGKSTLLQLILGELVPSSGMIQLGGEISYSSQEAWIFSSSVRKNILFGQKYDSLLYKKVTEVCALDKDFKQFPQGDQTIVGERGASLSGGQRARINLARAIYRKADIYLLDDPLSAVDTHVGKYLFTKCIAGYLKNKTRILVTHQLQYLKKVDHLVILNEGKIEAQGTFQELSKTNLDFTKMLIAADESTDEHENEKSAQQFVSRQPSLMEGSLQSTKSTIFTQSIRHKTSIFSISESIIDKALQNEDNEEETGNDTGESAFKSYMTAVHSTCLVATLIIGLIAAQAACAGADYWVAYWTNQEELRIMNHSNEAIETPNVIKPIDVFNLDSNDSNNVRYYSYDIRPPPPKIHTLSSSFFDQIQVNDGFMWIFKTYVALYIYAILIALAVILTLVRSMLFYFMAMRASTNMHSDMFNCLLRTPMRFFDTNLSGRVLNRFSKDMGAVDEILPMNLLEAIQVMLVMFGILINVAASNYYFLILMVVLGVVFLKIQQWFISNARAIKHLEGITISPVFSHVSSSLDGLTTIRASKAEIALIKEFDEHQNVHTSSWFLIIMCTVSFGLWLDIICVLFLGCVTFTFIITEDFVGGVNASLVGLAVSQALVLAGMVQNGMRFLAEVINQLTSVERIQQYTRLDTEDFYSNPKDEKPPGTWPRDGGVKFINLCLSYTPDDPPVLKHLNFTILPGEKVGIVGRTGAGKSSLISALFRLAPLKGTILIDDVNTKKIGLEDLRKNISIIPQEPVLFSATLRYNLDPCGDYDDKNLWRALEEVELKDVVDSLDFKISEGGSNFSLGQRQLLCLARAILRNNKILVLDEATANVDPRTDALIQTTIRKKFKHCTVLTIAHRLNTIMDSDKVLVMGGGRILEFDHPHKLLQIPEGHFYKMVLETGPSMTSNLTDVAAIAWDQKKNESPNRAVKNKII